MSLTWQKTRNALQFAEPKTEGERVAGGNQRPAPGVKSTATRQHCNPMLGAGHLEESKADPTKLN